MRTKDVYRARTGGNNFDRLMSSELGQRLLGEAQKETAHLAEKAQAARNTVTMPQQLDKIRQKLAEHAELLSNTPVIAKAAAAKAAHEASAQVPNDFGVRRAALTLRKAWEQDKAGAYTVSELARLRAHLLGEYPKSAVKYLFDEVLPDLAWQNLPIARLDKIASEIGSQQDYDFAMEFYGLDKNDAYSQKCRGYVLAQLNQAQCVCGQPGCPKCGPQQQMEAQSPEEGLSPEDLGQFDAPSGMFDQMKPDQMDLPVDEKSDWWRKLSPEQKMQYKDPMQQEGIVGPSDFASKQSDSGESGGLMAQAPQGQPSCPQCGQETLMSEEDGAVGCQNMQCPEIENGPWGKRWNQEDWRPGKEAIVGPSDFASKASKTAKEESEWWKTFKKENGMDEDGDKTASIRWAMKGLRQDHKRLADDGGMFEPDINDQQDDALSVGEGGKVAQSMPSKEPPQCHAAPEKPEEEEFKQVVPPNHQTDALAQPGTSASETSLKARRAQAAPQVGDQVTPSGGGSMTGQVVSLDEGYMPEGPSQNTSPGQFTVQWSNGQSVTYPSDLFGRSILPAGQGMPQESQMGKTEDGPADSQLGEQVEQMVNTHMEQNAPEELAEGHKPWAGKVSRARVEDLILNGKTIQASGYAIRIGSVGGKDQIEVVGSDIPAMVWPMKRMTAGIDFFAEMVETASGMEPGKINQQQPDAVSVPKDLGADTSSKEMEHGDPAVNQQQPDQLSPKDDFSSNDGEGFKTPAIRPPQPAQDQSGTSLSDTELGKHSSDGEGFQTPTIEPSSKRGKKASRDDIRAALKGGFRS